MMRCALLAACLLACAAPLTGQQGAADGERGAQPLRVFFLADMHSSQQRLEQLLADIERERPDVVLEGGDFVHDGTESEFRRAFEARTRARPPWHIARGNHDALLRGPLTSPLPALPSFHAFDHGHVRFLLLDNHDGTISDAQFAHLEADLEAHADRVAVVFMHVPPIVERISPLARLRHLAPFHVESPFMPDAAQVERFTALMEQHRVLAVLAGHTHFPDYTRRGGVHYIVAGAAGGLTPGLGIANEYLDITIDGRTIEVHRVPLADATADPVSLAVRAFRFYAALNGFNHRQQGWNYVPSASVQIGTALRRTERGAREDVALALGAAFERNLGTAGNESLFTDGAVALGAREAALHLAAGYRLRPIGSFNTGPFLAAGITGNAGRLDGSLSAGLGFQLAAGFAWHNLVLEIAGGRATNHRATSVGVGRRF